MSAPKLHVVIRGYRQHVKIFEERHAISDMQLVAYVGRLAKQHARALAEKPHMIEIEFLDEPDPNERFFRFGTDPTGMIMPIAVKL